MAHEPNKLPSRLKSVSKMLAIGLGSSLLSGCGVSASNDKCSLKQVNPASDNIARTILNNIKTHQPVNYDANNAVECGKYHTVLPLEAKISNTTHYYALVASGKQLRIMRILHPSGLEHQNWDENTGVRVTSTLGVADTKSVNGIPGIILHMSNGENFNAALAQTSVK